MDVANWNMLLQSFICKWAQPIKRAQSRAGLSWGSTLAAVPLSQCSFHFAETDSEELQVILTHFPDRELPSALSRGLLLPLLIRIFAPL